MKQYQGKWTERGCVVTVTVDDDAPVPLNPRFDLRNHSPTGFQWGYGGSGPAQLALALAADVLGDDLRAERVYQDLKWRLIPNMPAWGWKLSEGELRQAIGDVERMHVEYGE